MSFLEQNLLENDSGGFGDRKLSLDIVDKIGTFYISRSPVFLKAYFCPG